MLYIKIFPQSFLGSREKVLSVFTIYGHIPMHYTAVRNGKKKKGKSSQKKFKHCVFLLHEILQPSVDVYKIEDSGSLRH